MKNGIQKIDRVKKKMLNCDKSPISGAEKHSAFKVTAISKIIGGKP